MIGARMAFERGEKEGREIREVKRTVGVRGVDASAIFGSIRPLVTDRFPILDPHVLWAR